MRRCSPSSPTVNRGRARPWRLRWERPAHGAADARLACGSRQGGREVARGAPTGRARDDHDSPCLLPASESERSLHRALARSQRKRQGRARHDSPSRGRPSHRRMFPFDGRRQHDHFAPRPAPAQNPPLVALTPASAAARAKAARVRRATARDTIHRRASLGNARRDERASRHVSRPRFAQRAARRTTPDASRARSPCLLTHDRRQASTTSALDASNASTSSSIEESLLATRDSERAAGVFSTRDALSTSAISAGMPAWRAARSARASAAARCFSSAGLATRCPRRPARGPLATRAARPRVELGEPTLGLVEAPDQEEPPDLEIARMRGVHPVAVLFELRARCGRAPCQASPGRAKRARFRPRRRRTSRAPGPLSAEARAALRTSVLARNEIAELRHRDGRVAQRWRVVAQGDPVERAERIARGERARRGVISESPQSRHTCHSHRSLPGAKNVSHDQTLRREKR